MKHFGYFIRQAAAWIAACCLFTAGTAFAETRIVVASDLHYLSPTLTDHGEHFMNIIECADGKVTHYTPELVRAFVAQTVAEAPDAVVLSGDLTLNGAEVSHRELAELLEPLGEAGVPVYVLAGNHDTDGAAYSFFGDEVTKFPSTPHETFAAIYAGDGFDAAVSRDETSLSYLAKLTDKLWLLLIDTNANGTIGTVNRETLAWAREWLQAANDAGATVIGVSHQSLLTHNPRFQFGYLINNAGKLEALYREFDVRLNLSGHMHTQHIAESDGLTDIATSSLAVTPNQYAVLTVLEDGSMTYATKPVDVAAWAANNGVTDENLLDFARYSRDFFNATTERKERAALAETNIDANAAERMIALAVAMNEGYFGGTLTAVPDTEALAMWNTLAPDQRFTGYLNSIAAETLADMNHWSCDAPAK